MKEIEEFEVDESEGAQEEEINKKHRGYSFIKILILLFLILLISLIYFIFTGWSKKEKKNKIKKIQMQKKLLEEGTKKLVSVLATVRNTSDSLDTKIKETEELKKQKKEEINKYKNFININNSLILSEIKEERDKENKLFITFQEINEAYIKEKKIVKRAFINELNDGLNEKKIKNEIGTNIFDTDSEISLIKSWIDKHNFDNINLKLCYRGSDNFFSPIEAYNKCNLLHKFKEFLIIYQTVYFGRFGIFYGSQKHNDLSFVFEMEQKMRYLVPKKLVKIDVNRSFFPSFYFNDNDENKDIYPYKIKINHMLKNVEYENVDPDDFWVFGSFKVVEKNMPKMSDIFEIEIFYLD